MLVVVYQVSVPVVCWCICTSCCLACVSVPVVCWCIYASCCLVCVSVVCWCICASCCLACVSVPVVCWCICVSCCLVCVSVVCWCICASCCLACVSVPVVCWCICASYCLACISVPVVGFVCVRFRCFLACVPILVISVCLPNSCFLLRVLCTIVCLSLVSLPVYLTCVAVPAVVLQVPVPSLNFLVCVCASVPHFVCPLFPNRAIYSNAFCYHLHCFQNLIITLFYRKQQIISRQNYISLERHFMFRIIWSIIRWSGKCCALRIKYSSVDWSFVAFLISGTKRDELLKSKKPFFCLWSDNWSTLMFLQN